MRPPRPLFVEDDDSFRGVALEALEMDRLRWFATL